MLSYYVLEKKESDRVFLSNTPEGYFNLLNKVLIMKIKTYDDYFLLVNRIDKKFRKATIPNEESINRYIYEVSESLKNRIPKRMFEDFPELNTQKKCIYSNLRNRKQRINTETNIY